MTVEAAVDEGLTITGLVVRIQLPTTSYARQAYANTEPTKEQATWLVVRPDGTVTAFAGKVEYGQGIRSGLAIEVAEELRVPLSSVEVVLADTERVPWDMGTFGSQSTANVGVRLRKAAATARQELLALGADILDLPASELVCRDASVASASDPERKVGYGELLAGKRLSRELDEEVALTPAGDFHVMGAPAPRIDAVERVTGEAQFSQDVLLPDMLYASIVWPPAYGATLTQLDASAAERLPGVVQVARDGDLVAVLAESDEQAAKAADIVAAEWAEVAGQPSHIDVPELLKSKADEGFTTQEAGSLDEGFKLADGVLESMYFGPFVSTAPMEPRAAVARWDGDRLTVWAGSQRPFGVRAELAQHFEIDEEVVRVIGTEVGGGFGSKSYYPLAIDAARLAKIAGRPVRVAYTRSEEMRWTTFRPAALFEVKSGFRSDGTLVAWQCTAYHAGDRPFVGRRGSETPYDVPHVSVTVHTSESPLRTGSYRSLGGALNHFARESHMDEIAAQAGVDPVELRLRNLSHPRFRRVLEEAASRFGWSGATAPSGRGAGAAIGLDVGSYVATCVQVSARGSEVAIERVSAALDCGLTVNPDGAANQVEGSIVMGLGTALYEAIDFQGGRVLNTGFARYRVPRMTDAPSIDVALVGEPDAPSTGAGEPGIVPVAPAIANALYDLTGERCRELPIQRHRAR